MPITSISNECLPNNLCCISSSNSNCKPGPGGSTTQAKQNINPLYCQRGVRNSQNWNTSLQVTIHINEHPACNSSTTSNEHLRRRVRSDSQRCSCYSLPCSMEKTTEVYAASRTASEGCQVQQNIKCRQQLSKTESNDMVMDIDHEAPPECIHIPRCLWIEKTDCSQRCACLAINQEATPS